MAPPAGGWPLISPNPVSGQRPDRRLLAQNVLAAPRQEFHLIFVKRVSAAIVILAIFGND